MSGAVKAVKSVVKGVVNAVKSVVKAVGKVVSAVVNFVVQPFMGLLGGMGGIPDSVSEAQRQEGVLITNIGGGNVNIPVVYGLRQIGGTVIYAETGSDNNKYLWVLYALSEGPVEGIYNIEIDTEDITTSSLISKLNAGEQAGVDKAGSRYSGKTQFQFWSGTFANSSQVTQLATYTANHLMKSAPSWKSSNVMNGMSCLLARYEYKKATTQEEADNNPFSGSIPNIRVTLLGRKVASLLSGAGQENYEYGASGYVERYSTNPAEILLDYLRNPRYGKGLTNAEIDWTSFRRAANKFNQTVTYITGTTGPILTCNHVLDTSASIMSNVKVLLQGMRSYMPYVQGKYKLSVEDAGNSTDILSGVATVAAVFNKDNIVGDITYTGIDRSAQYTAVEVTYVSPADKWSTQTVIYPSNESERLAAAVENGGRENSGTFTFPTLTNYAMAYDMARLIWNKSRYQQALTFTATSQAGILEPGDNIHINAQVLDFYDETDPGSTENIPWRIVSLRMNADFSYDVDCVRNPDFIYPHARANERDIVLPPYIPRGSYIYYPGVFTDVGLYPPGHAYWTPTQQPGDTNSGGFDNDEPTDPTDPDQGGGVGDPTYPGGDVTPVETPPPPPLRSYIEVDQVTYTLVGNTVTATLRFKQPSHPMYAGIDFWYKRTITTDTQYQRSSNTDLPGADQYITHTITGLIKGNIGYILIGRVKYDNGDSSEVISKTYLTVSGAVSSENPPDYNEQVGSAWSLPTGDSGVFARDTILSKVEAYPVYESAGVPVTPRQLRFVVTQDINSKGFNSNVAGINIYYRPNAAVYWYKHSETFDGSYFPGVAYEFTPTLSLGTRTYPNSDDASDQYCWAFRFFYKDGTESTLQARIMNGTAGVDIENTANSDIFYPVSKTYEEAVTAYEIITVDQAPPGAVVDPRDIRVSFIKLLNNFTTPTKARFFINPPVASMLPYWEGVRVYRSLAQSGVTDTIDFTPVPNPSGERIFEVEIDWDEQYEFVIVPLVTYLGTTTEAANAWYMFGIMHDRQIDPDYPGDGNWLGNYTYEFLETSAAMAKIGTAEPAGIRKDTYFSALTGATLLTGGVPRNPREISITATQETATSGINGDIKGLKIYYKPTNFNYWSYTSYLIPTPYTEGDPITFTFPEGLGIPAYPNAPTNNNKYDFVFRFTYTDDSESNKQMRIMGCAVEKDAFGSYSFDPFSAVTKITEAASDYELITVDNAPPGAVADPRDIVNAPTSLVASQNSARFTIQPPVSALLGQWYGIRLRYRKITAEGGVINWESRDYFPVSQPVTGVYQISLPIEYDQDYQYVLTPVVRYNGVKTEATYSYIGRGRIHNRESAPEFPSDFNWLPRLSFTKIESALISDISAEPLPTSLNVVVKRWAGISLGTAYTYQSPNYSYFELEFDHKHIKDFEKLYVYRRAYTPSQAGWGTTYAQYTGLGRWERVEITTTNPTGTVVANLRWPISSREYDFYYEILASATLKSTIAPWSSKLLMQTISSASMYQFLVVAVTTGGVEASNGLLLTGITGFPSTSIQTIINYDTPTVVELASLNGYLSGYERNLSDYRTAPSAGDIVTSYRTTDAYSAPTALRGGSVV